MYTKIDALLDKIENATDIAVIKEIVEYCRNDGDVRGTNGMQLSKLSLMTTINESLCEKFFSENDFKRETFCLKLIKLIDVKYECEAFHNVFDVVQIDTVYCMTFLVHFNLGYEGMFKAMNEAKPPAIRAMMKFPELIDSCDIEIDSVGYEDPDRCILHYMGRDITEKMLAKAILARRPLNVIKYLISRLEKIDICKLFKRIYRDIRKDIPYDNETYKLLLNFKFKSLDMREISEIMIDKIFIADMNSMVKYLCEIEDSILLDTFKKLVKGSSVSCYKEVIESKLYRKIKDIIKVKVDKSYIVDSTITLENILEYSDIKPYEINFIACYREDPEYMMSLVGDIDIKYQDLITVAQHGDTEFVDLILENYSYTNEEIETFFELYM
ncbi:hypothetical protein D3C87_862730 [compost metagenome]